jgi:GNAT superfamily N-acetyltransferase
MTSEAEILTGISFAAKGYWRYPQEYFRIWADELTIRPEYIGNNDVFVLEQDGVVVGYYAVVELKEDIRAARVTIGKGFWLEHMFIEPRSLRKGMGTWMFIHLRDLCRSRGISELGILADPHAGGFYEKMGCEYKGEYPSTISGRTTPFFLLKVIHEGK